ncbi:MAG: pilus assembly protein TadG-related protein [Burkholderiaceae bacterium]
MSLVSRFLQDTSGSYLIIGAVMMPVLVGAVGLGTDYGLWVHSHQMAQSATDSAAVSAATDGNSANLTAQAGAIAASYGFVNGANGATVTVNQPPKSGSYTDPKQNAVEVIIKQQRAPLFSAVFLSQAVTITARSVAIRSAGTGCVLGLNRTASSTVAVSGSNNLNLINCNLYSDSNASPSLNVSGTAKVSANQVLVVGDVSGASNITATNGIRTGMAPIADPYANVTPPQKPSCNNAKITVNSNGKTTVLDPGCYSGSITVNAGATLNLNPGIYYLDGATFSVAGNATVTGSGVTLVFTGSGSSWGSASIGSNANVTLTAPSSGSTKGIVMYGDRNMPVGTAFNLEGSGTQNFGGAIDLPKAALKFAGGNGTTTSCTQIIADTITFTGSSNVQVNCPALGTSAIGVQTAQLVE